MTRQIYLTDNQWYTLRELVQSNTILILLAGITIRETI